MSNTRIVDGDYETPRDVMLSYSHEDALIADGLVGLLRREGLSVWRDSIDLRISDQWSRVISHQIMTCKKAVVAIVSASSVRRYEVVRELLLAYERSMDDPGFKLVILKVGPIRPSWINRCGRDEEVKDLVDFLGRSQFVGIEKGSGITLDVARKIIDYICPDGSMAPASQQGGSLFADACFSYGQGFPERVCPDGGPAFYRVQPGQVSCSSVYAPIMDDQWLPVSDWLAGGDFAAVFSENGFGSPDVTKHIYRLRKTELARLLLSSRNLIVNKSALLNNHVFKRLYAPVDEVDPGEAQAFKNLLGDGAIIVLLYEAGEIGPTKEPGYAVERGIVDAWNRLCGDVEVHCMRSSWRSPVDRHADVIAHTMSSLSIDGEKIGYFANLLGIEEGEFSRRFAGVEKAIYELSRKRLESRRNSPGAKLVSRSDVYKLFVTGIKPEDVRLCRLREDKGFSMAVKLVVDYLYNSIFCNAFQCQMGVSLEPDRKAFFLNEVFCTHGVRPVGSDELVYALDGLVRSNAIWDALGKLRVCTEVSEWGLSAIRNVRGSIAWLEYIELLEAIIARCHFWQMDFDYLGNLVGKFVLALNENGASAGQVQGAEMCWSMRVCIEDSMIDVVVRKAGDGPARVAYRRTDASLDISDDQNALLVFFAVGDMIEGMGDIARRVFAPLKVFDGSTGFELGTEYLDKVEKYLAEYQNLTVRNCG